MTAGKAAEVFGTKLNDEQELLMHIADMVIEIYVAESVLLRTEKLMKLYGEDGSRLYQDLTQLYLYEAVQKVKSHGDEAVSSFTTGDELKVMLMGLKRFTKTDPVNTTLLRRNVADQMIKANKFPYSLYQ